MLEHHGERLAALVHDPSLLDEPKLVEAAGAAARLALENARLQAETRAQLEEVRLPLGGRGWHLIALDSNLASANGRRGGARLVGYARS